MKTIITKIGIIASIVLLLGLNSSCVVEDYVDCANAQVEIYNGTTSYVGFTINPNDPYCYSGDVIAPGESIIFDYGEIHTSRDMPHYFYFGYRYGTTGYAVDEMNIEIESCYNRVDL